MTFEEALKRIVFRWWLILIFFVVFTLVFFNWTTSNSYSASIGLGISFNSKDFVAPVLPEDQPQVKSSSELVVPRNSEYTSSLDEFTKYLAGRFSSVEIQSSISKKAELNIQSLNSKQPFYTVTPQGGGYISVTYEASKKETAEKFIEATKEVYKDLVETERQNQELSQFQISPKNDFIESVSPVSKPTQFQILPSVAGFLFGVMVSILWPIRNELSKEKSKKSRNS